MSKGFIVKANNPTAGNKGPEWDYDKIKERWRGKRLSSVFLVVDAHIHFLRALSNYRLTWFRME